MSEKKRQINGIVESLDSAYHSWLLAMDEWCENQKGDIPNLPAMVEDLLNHLRGLDEKLARSYEWMMIL